MNVAKALEELECIFREVKSEEVFSMLGDRMARREDGTALFVPCLPVVGRNYGEGGILVIATAQNWRDADPLTDVRRELYRQWPNSTPSADGIESHLEVLIEPWRCGMLPGLVGMYLLAHGHEPPRTLEEIASRCAVTNFFKFSLRARGGGKGTDLNPQRLPPEELEDFIKLTFDHFVRHELEILRPGVIISFARPYGKYRYLSAWADERHPKPVDLYEVNDPAWIKRGMRQTTWPAQSKAPACLSAYLDRMESPYCSGKKGAAERYLLHYLKVFREQQRNRQV